MEQPWTVREYFTWRLSNNSSRKWRFHSIKSMSKETFSISISAQLKKKGIVLISLFHIMTHCDSFWMQIETTQRFYDFMTQSKLCPVVATLNHAMVVDSAKFSRRYIGPPTRYYQCKNTYPNNRRILVCPTWPIPDPSFEFIYNAIIIQFSK